MKPSRSSKQSSSRLCPYRLLLSFGLPLLLLLSFLVSQFINLDNIDWNEGFNHPLSGWDHLGTMVAVGIWAAQLRGQAIWMLPLAFVGVMSLGGLAGAANLAIPSVEGIILLSCAVFSVLITRRVRFNTYINLLIVAFFAFFHGFAHGHEISTSTSLISYTLGFMLATLLLHGSGILIAKFVVLSASFLLTAMFSASALAKVHVSTIADDGHGGAVFGFQKSVLYGGSHVTDVDRLHFEQRCQSTAKDSRAEIATIGSGLSDLSLRRLPINDVKKLMTATKSSRLSKIAALGRVPFTESGYRLLTSVDRCLSVLPFKYYFPDINHTPGLPLLSGGVGLTSPPAASALLANSQAVPNLRNTPVSPIEAHSLQALDVPVATGIDYSKSPQDFSQSSPSWAQRLLSHHRTTALGCCAAWSFFALDVFNRHHFNFSFWATGLITSSIIPEKQCFENMTRTLKPT